MYNEATKDTQDAIALGYTIQDYSGTCIACDAAGVTVTSCGRCIPCAVGKPGRKSVHEAGDAGRIAQPCGIFFSRPEWHMAGYVSLIDAFTMHDPFQMYPTAYAGRLVYGERLLFDAATIGEQWPSF